MYQVIEIDMETGGISVTHHSTIEVALDEATGPGNKPIPFSEWKEMYSQGKLWGEEYRHITDEGHTGLVAVLPTTTQFEILDDSLRYIYEGKWMVTGIFHTP